MTVVPRVAVMHRDADPVVLGARIRALRGAADLSQAQLGSSAGVTGAYVSRVETGERRPSVGTLEGFAGALGVPVHVFFDVPDAPSDARPSWREAAAARCVAEASSRWLQDPTNVMSYLALVTATQQWESYLDES